MTNMVAIGEERIQAKSMQNRMFRAIPLLIFMLLLAVPASADEPVHYDRIRFSVKAGTAVTTDVLVAVMTAQRQGKDPGKLAFEVNQLIREALRKCHQVPKVDVQTLGYKTLPLYDKGQRNGWRVSQSLQIKSRVPAALGKLLGELQQHLLLTGMSYQVSPERRHKTENILIRKAISEYRKRAMIITRQLEHQQYRIISMQIDTGGSSASPSPIRRFQAFAAERTVPTQIESGKQPLTVTVSGLIELK